MTNPIKADWKPVKATLKQRIIGTGGVAYVIPHFKTHIIDLQNSAEKKVVLLIFLKWAFSWTYTRAIK